MKYEWKTNAEKYGTLEEGMEKARQEYIKELEYKKSGWGKWRYIKLIVLLILILFFGWNLYIVFQTYHSRVTENEVTGIILERYLPAFESQKSEAEKSNPNTEMSVIFVKPEVIMDKLNNFLGDIKLIKEQDSMQDEAIAMDMLVTVHTSTQNPISVESDNSVRIDSGSKSNEDLNHVEKSTNLRLSMPWKVFSTGYIDEVTDKVPTHNKYHPIVEKLLDIAKMNVDLEEYKKENKNNEDINRLTLNSQEKHVLDASNKLESLILDTTTISSLEDSVDRKTNVNPNCKTYSLQEYLDSIKDIAQDDHNNSNSFSDEQVNKQNDEQVNVDSELELVICPPYESYEDSDVSLKDMTKESSISQPVSAPKISEQMENQSSDDVGTRNENKHDVDDNISIEDSDIWLPPSNVQHNPWMKDPYEFLFPHLKIRDSVESSQSNIDDSNVSIRDPIELRLSQSKMQDSVESSQSNIGESNVSIRDPYEFLLSLLKIQDSVESSQSNIDESDVSIRDPYEFLFPHLRIRDSVESSQSNIDESDVSISDPYEFLFPHLKIRDSVESLQSNIDDVNMSIRNPYESSFSQLKIQDSVESSKSNIDDNNMSIKDSSELWFPHLKIQDNVESTKSNIDDSNMPIITLSIPQSAIMQDSIESSTSNVGEFQWFNAPARFADNLQTGSVDISKSNKTPISSFGDTSDDTDEQYFISKNKCKIQIENYLLKVTCSDVGFDEKWNLTSSEMLTEDASEDASVDYIKSNEKSTGKVEDELISTENSNEKVAISQDGVPEAVNAIKLQEIISSAKTLNNVALDLSEIEKSDSFDITRVNQDDANSPNKEEIKQTFIFTFKPNSDTIDSNEKWDLFDSSDTQQEQLENMEEQDYSDYEDLETSSEMNEHINALDKELTSMLVDELRQYLSRNNDYMDDICMEHPYLNIHCTYPYSSLWNERFETLKIYLQYLRNRALLVDNHRKKRMADDLTIQEQVSNALDDNKNVKLKNLLENLKNLYQKMEILAACIDELHKQYLLHNKLEDNYIPNELPMKVGESQKT